MVETAFIASVFLVFFSYLGYPVTLLIAGWIRGKEVKRADVYPSVTFIITVHNEAKRIADKLDNTLALSYPMTKLQILVASDGSTDATNEIVQRYSARGVQLLALTGRGGKESAQREAVKLATGDVIVFSDVATAMEAGGLRQLVSSFADPEVGCVSSSDRLIGRDGKPSGEGLYVRYEMWLRSLESRVGSLVGLSGSLFAARKEVCKDFSAEMQSDFRTVLNCVKAGLRGVSDPLALGVYRDTADRGEEWNRKVRTVVRGLTVFFCHTELLNFMRYGLFSYQLICHKLLRWLVPCFLIIAFVSNLALVYVSDVYGVLFLGQVVFYGIGVLGIMRPAWQELWPVKIPAYFLAVNGSILQAWWRYFRGDRVVTWTPTQR